MPDVTPSEPHDELVYESGGLPRTINWWGAFVIGLAGTILVTGIAPTMVTTLGPAWRTAPTPGARPASSPAGCYARTST